MSKLSMPTIERTRPERARQISQDACRGQEWIRTPTALGASLVLIVLGLIFIAIGMIGMVGP